MWIILFFLIGVVSSKVNDEFPVTKNSMFFGYQCDSLYNVSLVELEGDNACEVLDSSKYRNNMVVVFGLYAGDGGMCSYERRYKNIADTGAIGILDVDNAPPGQWIYLHSHELYLVQNYTMPMYSFHQKDYDAVDHIHSLECDDSEWEDYNTPNWIVYNLFGALISFISGLVGVYHWYIFATHKRNYTVELILAINSFQAIMLFFQYCFGFGFGGPIIPTNIRAMVIPMWSALHATSLGINAFFFRDQRIAFTKLQKSPNVLYEKKWILIGVFCPLLLFDVFRMANSGLFGSPFAAILGGTIFFMCQIGFGGWNVYEGQRYLKSAKITLQTTSGNYTDNHISIAKLLHHMSIYLKWTALFIFMFNLGIIPIVVDVVDNPTGTILVGYWFAFWKVGALLLQNIGLRPPDAKYSQIFTCRKNFDSSSLTTSKSSSNAIRVSKS